MTVNTMPGRKSSSGSELVEDTKTSNVKVVVRVRPENSHELEANSRTVVKVLDENVLIFDPNEESEASFFHGKRRTGRDLLKRKNKDMRFAFDRVFDSNVSQQEVYENTTKSIIDGVLNGYNCSVFAYGATGAGKTFTMLGSQDSPGVIFNTMVELYRRIDDMKEEKTCEVAVSYLEVYNENIRDLLLPGKVLAVREDNQKHVVVAGLSLHQPSSAEELLYMLDYGNKNRTQHPTDANAQSSRSHAVFQVFVKQKDRTAGLSANVKVAKMSLIDLAGSERATVTTNRGARFREGANINRSLLALGNCINALANPKTKSCHIPYRNSKLTRLLKDSLGGNCRTVMIAAVSPSNLSYEDTYNTLKYANRAKDIRSLLKSNVVNVDFHVSKYAQIVKELRAEVFDLKVKLKSYEDGTITVNNRRQSLEYRSRQDEINRLQHTMLTVFIERANIRKELMELESSDRDLTMKITRKERNKERFKLIKVNTHELGKMTTKLDRVIAVTKNRQTRLHETKAKVDLRMVENQEKVERLQSEFPLIGQDNETPEILATTLRMRHLEVEIKDLRRQVKHLQKHARVQENDMQSSERLIQSLLILVRKQHFILKGSDLATSDITEEFEVIQKSVDGDKEVAWADETAVSSAEEMKSILDFPVLSCVPATPSACRTPGLKRLISGDEDSLTEMSITPYKVPIKTKTVIAESSHLDNTVSVSDNTVSVSDKSRIEAQRIPRFENKATKTAVRIQTPRYKAVPSIPNGDVRPKPVRRNTFTLDEAAMDSTINVNRDCESVHNAADVDCEEVTERQQICENGVKIAITPSKEPICVSSMTPGKANTPSYADITKYGKERICSPSTESDISSVPSNNDNRATMKSTLPSLSNADIVIDGISLLVSPVQSVLSASKEELKSPDLAKVGRSTGHSVHFDSKFVKTATPCTPVGTKRSYAEVVCTPTPVKASPRTPLTSVGNSPIVSDCDSVFASSSPEVTFNRLNTSYTLDDKINKEKLSLSGRKQGLYAVEKENFSSDILHNLKEPPAGPIQRRETIATATVKRYGLPSVMPNKNIYSKQRSDLGFRRPKPTYMMMTKAASNKRKHRRSLSSQEKTSVQFSKSRLPTVKTSNMSLPRSKSYGNLHSSRQMY